MIRVKLSRKRRADYFDTLQTVASRRSITQTINVSLRTLYDWKRGKHRIPYSVLIDLERSYGIPVPPGIKLVDTLAESSAHGRLGGSARLLKHGPPGTPDGRIKGGKNSITTHKSIASGFQVQVTYKNPRVSKLFAEFIGILVGDGHISDYQISVYLNKVDDSDYAKIVSGYIEALFGYKPHIHHHRLKKLSRIPVSSKHIVSMLISHGLLPGNKIISQQVFPEWIVSRKSFYIASLRGLFDTDGSVFIDKHTIGSKKYRSLNVSYTIMNKSLYNQVLTLLRSIGFHPTTSTKDRISIRKSREVDAFFSIIQPANPKHIRRYKYLKLEE